MATPHPRSVAVLFREFLKSEQSGGLLLVFAAMAALAMAQTPWGPAIHSVLERSVGGQVLGLHLEHTVLHWINDGLMAVFFLLIGLEIEREIYTGQLSRLRTASLPFFAALGGMVVPVAIHFAFNGGSPTAKGAGIPMATDIAFALAVLALLGPRVPISLKIFLAAFAILDDLGAILVIGLFYGKGIAFGYLAIAAALFGILLLLNRLKVVRLWPYLLLGVPFWYAVGESGIHASVAGVLLAFAIPFAGGGEKSPSTVLQHRLHGPVAFFILPLFALANTGVPLSMDLLRSLDGPNGWGIFFGSLLGKPLGIVLFSLLAMRLGLSSLPEGMNRRHLLGVGFLGGVGFTMAIFITELAFPGSPLVNQSKTAILLASVAAAVTGYFILKGRFKA